MRSVNRNIKVAIRSADDLNARFNAIKIFRFILSKLCMI